MFKKKEKLSQEDIEQKHKKERTNFDWQVAFKNKRNIGLLIMLLTLFCVFIANPCIEYLQSREEITIFLAQEDIEKGTEITPEMIKKVQTPQSAIAGQISFDTSPIGKFSKTTIFKDEIITKAIVSDNMPFRDEYLYSLPLGKKAISVSLSSLAQGLSAKLKAGDIVTVYAFIDEERESEKFIASQPKELEYVKVLAVSDGEGRETVAVGTAPAATAATATLLVSDEQAKVLVGLENQSAIHLAVALRGNEEQAQELLKMQEMYFEQAVANVPQEEPQQDTEVTQ